MKITIIMTLCYLCLTTIFPSQVQAHYPWVNSNNYTPEPGETPYITIGWGHRYPLSKLLQQKDLESIYMINPNGDKENIASQNGLVFAPDHSLGIPGTYIIAAERKTGFYTKTTQGGKRQSKKGLSNVLSCSLSHMSMKSLLTVGKERTRVDRKVDHPLEIIPLANPTELSVGEYLPIQLLLHGKPYKGTISATYIGFSTDKEVFAYTAKTDRQGKGKIRILQPGIWLLKTEHTQPYQDQNECDVEKWIATLTLEIK